MHRARRLYLFFGLLFIAELINGQLHVSLGNETPGSKSPQQNKKDHDKKITSFGNAKDATLDKLGLSKKATQQGLLPFHPADRSFATDKEIANHVHANAKILCDNLSSIEDGKVKNKDVESFLKFSFRNELKEAMLKRSVKTALKARLLTEFIKSIGPNLGVLEWPNESKQFVQPTSKSALKEQLERQEKLLQALTGPKGRLTDEAVLLFELGFWFVTEPLGGRESGGGKWGGGKWGGGKWSAGLRHADTATHPYQRLFSGEQNQAPISRARFKAKLDFISVKSPTPFLDRLLKQYSEKLGNNGNPLFLPTTDPTKYALNALKDLASGKTPISETQVGALLAWADKNQKEHPELRLFSTLIETRNSGMGTVIDAICQVKRQDSLEDFADDRDLSTYAKKGFFSFPPSVSATPKNMAQILDKNIHLLSQAQKLLAEPNVTYRDIQERLGIRSDPSLWNKQLSQQAKKMIGDDLLRQFRETFERTSRTGATAKDVFHQQPQFSQQDVSFPPEAEKYLSHKALLAEDLMHNNRRGFPKIATRIIQELQSAGKVKCFSFEMPNGSTADLTDSTVSLGAIFKIILVQAPPLQSRPLWERCYSTDPETKMALSYLKLFARGTFRDQKNRFLPLRYWAMDHASDPHMKSLPLLLTAIDLTQQQAANLFKSLPLVDDSLKIAAQTLSEGHKLLTSAPSDRQQEVKRVIQRLGQRGEDFSLEQAKTLINLSDKDFKDLQTIRQHSDVLEDESYLRHARRIDLPKLREEAQKWRQVFYLAPMPANLSAEQKAEFLAKERRKALEALQELQRDDLPRLYLLTKYGLFFMRETGINLKKDLDDFRLTPGSVATAHDKAALIRILNDIAYGLRQAADPKIVEKDIEELSKLPKEFYSALKLTEKELKDQVRKLDAMSARMLLHLFEKVSSQKKSPQQMFDAFLTAGVSNIDTSINLVPLIANPHIATLAAIEAMPNLTEEIKKKLTPEQQKEIVLSALRNPSIIQRFFVADHNNNPDATAKSIAAITDQLDLKRLLANARDPEFKARFPSEKAYRDYLLWWQTELQHHLDRHSARVPTQGGQELAKLLSDPLHSQAADAILELLYGAQFVEAQKLYKKSKNLKVEEKGVAKEDPDKGPSPAGVGPLSQPFDELTRHSPEGLKKIIHGKDSKGNPMMSAHDVRQFLGHLDRVAQEGKNKKHQLDSEARVCRNIMNRNNVLSETIAMFEAMNQFPGTKLFGRDAREARAKAEEIWKKGNPKSTQKETDDSTHKIFLAFLEEEAQAYQKRKAFYLDNIAGAVDSKEIKNGKGFPLNYPDLTGYLKKQSTNHLLFLSLELSGKYPKFEKRGGGISWNEFLAMVNLEIYSRFGKAGFKDDISLRGAHWTKNAIENLQPDSGVKSLNPNDANNLNLAFANFWQAMTSFDPPERDTSPRPKLESLFQTIFIPHYKLPSGKDFYNPEAWVKWATNQENQDLALKVSNGAPVNEALERIPATVLIGGPLLANHLRKMAQLAQDNPEVGELDKACKEKLKQFETQITKINSGIEHANTTFKQIALDRLKELGAPLDLSNHPFLKLSGISIGVSVDDEQKIFREALKLAKDSRTQLVEIAAELNNNPDKYKSHAAHKRAVEDALRMPPHLFNIAMQLEKEIQDKKWKLAGELFSKKAPIWEWRKRLTELSKLPKDSLVRKHLEEHDPGLKTITRAINALKRESLYQKFDTESDPPVIIRRPIGPLFEDLEKIARLMEIISLLPSNATFPLDTLKELKKVFGNQQDLHALERELSELRGLDDYQMHIEWAAYEKKERNEDAIDRNKQLAHSLVTQQKLHTERNKSPQIITDPNKGVGAGATSKEGWSSDIDDYLLSIMADSGLTQVNLVNVLLDVDRGRNGQIPGLQKMRDYYLKKLHGFRNGYSVSLFGSKNSHEAKKFYRSDGPKSELLELALANVIRSIENSALSAKLGKDSIKQALPLLNQGHVAQYRDYLLEEASQRFDAATHDKQEQGKDKHKREISVETLDTLATQLLEGALPTEVKHKYNQSNPLIRKMAIMLLEFGKRAESLRAADGKEISGNHDILKHLASLIHSTSSLNIQKTIWANDDLRKQFLDFLRNDYLQWWVGDSGVSGGVKYTKLGIPLYKNTNELVRTLDSLPKMSLREREHASDWGVKELKAHQVYRKDNVIEFTDDRIANALALLSLGEWVNHSDKDIAPKIVSTLADNYRFTPHGALRHHGEEDVIRKTLKLTPDGRKILDATQTLEEFFSRLGDKGAILPRESKLKLMSKLMPEDHQALAMVIERIEKMKPGKGKEEALRVLTNSIASGDRNAILLLSVAFAPDYLRLAKDYDPLIVAQKQLVRHMIDAASKQAAAMGGAAKTEDLFTRLGVLLDEQNPHFKTLIVQKANEWLSSLVESGILGEALKGEHGGKITPFSRLRSNPLLKGNPNQLSEEVQKRLPVIFDKHQNEIAKGIYQEAAKEVAQKTRIEAAMQIIRQVIAQKRKAHNIAPDRPISWLELFDLTKDMGLADDPRLLALLLPLMPKASDPKKKDDAEEKAKQTMKAAYERTINSFDKYIAAVKADPKKYPGLDLKQLEENKRVFLAKNPNAEVFYRRDFIERNLRALLREYLLEDYASHRMTPFLAEAFKKEEGKEHQSKNQGNPLSTIPALDKNDPDVAGRKQEIAAKLGQLDDAAEDFHLQAMALKQMLRNAMLDLSVSKTSKEALDKMSVHSMAPKGLLGAIGYYPFREAHKFLYAIGVDKDQPGKSPQQKQDDNRKYILGGTEASKKEQEKFDALRKELEKTIESHEKMAKEALAQRLKAFEERLDVLINEERIAFNRSIKSIDEAYSELASGWLKEQQKKYDDGKIDSTNLYGWVLPPIFPGHLAKTIATIRNNGQEPTKEQILAVEAGFKNAKDKQNYQLNKHAAGFMKIEQDATTYLKESAMHYEGIRKSAKDIASAVQVPNEQIKLDAGGVYPYLEAFLKRQTAAHLIEPWLNDTINPSHRLRLSDAQAKSMMNDYLKQAYEELKQQHQTFDDAVAKLVSLDSNFAVMGSPRGVTIDDSNVEWWKYRTTDEIEHIKKECAKKPIPEKYRFECTHVKQLVDNTQLKAALLRLAPYTQSKISPYEEFIHGLKTEDKSLGHPSVFKINNKTAVVAENEFSKDGKVTRTHRLIPLDEAQKAVDALYVNLDNNLSKLAEEKNNIASGRNSTIYGVFPAADVETRKKAGDALHAAHNEIDKDVIQLAQFGNLIPANRNDSKKTAQDLAAEKLIQATLQHFETADFLFRDQQDILSRQRELGLMMLTELAATVAIGGLSKLATAANAIRIQLLARWAARGVRLTQGTLALAKTATDLHWAGKILEHHQQNVSWFPFSNAAKANKFFAEKSKDFWIKAFTAGLSDDEKKKIPPGLDPADNGRPPWVKVEPNVIDGKTHYTVTFLPDKVPGYVTENLESEHGYNKSLYTFMLSGPAGKLFRTLGLGFRLPFGLRLDHALGFGVPSGLIEYADTGKADRSLARGLHGAAYALMPHFRGFKGASTLTFMGNVGYLSALDAVVMNHWNHKFAKEDYDERVRELKEQGRVDTISFLGPPPNESEMAWRSLLSGLPMTSYFAGKAASRSHHERYLPRILAFARSLERTRSGQGNSSDPNTSPRPQNYTELRNQIAQDLNRPSVTRRIGDLVDHVFGRERLTPEARAEQIMSQHLSQMSVDEVLAILENSQQRSQVPGANASDHQDILNGISRSFPGIPPARLIETLKEYSKIGASPLLRLGRLELHEATPGLQGLVLKQMAKEAQDGVLTPQRLAEDSASMAAVTMGKVQDIPAPNGNARFSRNHSDNVRRNLEQYRYNFSNWRNINLDKVLAHFTGKPTEQLFARQLAVYLGITNNPESPTAYNFAAYLTYTSGLRGEPATLAAIRQEVGQRFNSLQERANELIERRTPPPQWLTNALTTGTAEPALMFVRAGAIDRGQQYGLPLITRVLTDLGVNTRDGGAGREIFERVKQELNRPENSHKSLAQVIEEIVAVARRR